MQCLCANCVGRREIALWIASQLSPRQIIFYLTKDGAQRPVSTPNWLHGETGSMICTGAKWNVQQPHDTTREKEVEQVEEAA